MYAGRLQVQSPASDHTAAASGSSVTGLAALHAWPLGTDQPCQHDSAESASRLKALSLADTQNRPSAENTRFSDHGTGAVSGTRPASFSSSDRRDPPLPGNRASTGAGWAPSSSADEAAHHTSGQAFSRRESFQQSMPGRLSQAADDNPKGVTRGHGLSPSVTSCKPAS